MKSILSEKQKMNMPVKLAIILVVVIAGVSFYLSVKYSGANKKIVPELTFDRRIAAPGCSSEGGFYKDAFSVKLTCNDPEATIYYTLDGSMPTLNSILYHKPVIIERSDVAGNELSAIPTSPRWKPPLNAVYKGTVIRAIAVRSTKKGNELDRTFFIDEKGNDRYSFPVVALTVNPDDLFGFKNGIYIMGKNYEDKSDYIRKKIPLDIQWWKYPSNYLKRGSNSERPAHIEYYLHSGRLGFEVTAGIRVNGNATRGFSQKSLRLCFDKDFSSGPLEYPLFENYPVKRFNSLVLRNAGNDWDKTMFRDVLMQDLMKGSKVLVQHYQPVIVFINGEYWGIHNICERFDENFLANLYTINKDSVALLEVSGGKLMGGKKGDVSDFEDFMKDLAGTDYSKANNYEALCKQIDVESFMDMIISNVYYCNSDWPANNVKFWRYRTEAETSDSAGVRDGRWRWMLYDTDWGFGYTGRDAVNLNLLEKVKKSAYIGVIFDKLLRNKKFSTDFEARFDHYLETNFKPEIVLEKINELEAIYGKEMSEHIDRWRIIGSYANWKKNVQELRDFEAVRPSIQRKQLTEFIKSYK